MCCRSFVGTAPWPQRIQSQRMGTRASSTMPQVKITKLESLSERCWLVDSFTEAFVALIAMARPTWVSPISQGSLLTIVL